MKSYLYKQLIHLNNSILIVGGNLPSWPPILDNVVSGGRSQVDPPDSVNPAAAVELGASEFIWPVVIGLLIAYIVIKIKDKFF